MSDNRGPFTLPALPHVKLNYAISAIAAARISQPMEPNFPHVVTTYVDEVNKTVSRSLALPDDLLEFKPYEMTNTTRTLRVHQSLPERQFLGPFVGIKDRR